LITHQFAVL